MTKHLDQDDKCYICGKAFKTTSKKYLVNVNKDDQHVYVGPECYKRVVKADKDGYQPKGDIIKYYINKD